MSPTARQNSTNNVVQQFDIIAARPTTERFFLAACATLEVDIISLDLQEYVLPSSPPLSAACAEP
jgi:RNase P/RNase MRP subunit p30